MHKQFIGFAAAGLIALPLGTARAQTPPMPKRFRGTVQSVAAHELTIVTASGPVHLRLSGDTKFADLVPSDRAHVKPGSFLGIASETQPDGSQRAVEISVFPEAMRGTGEGSYPWDLPSSAEGHSASHSRMTNGTVAATPAASHSRMTNGTVSSHAAGSSLTLTYKGVGGTGAQPIVIPPGIPIVTFGPGTIAELKPGAHVFVIAAPQAKGAFTAMRVMIGKNGLTPPM